MGINYITVTLIAAAVIIAVIAFMTRKPRSFSKLAAIAATITSIGGILLYGYAFSKLMTNPALAVIRTVYAVIGIFVGKDEMSVIRSVQPFDQQGWQIVHWLIQLLGLFATASAAVSAFGRGTLNRLKMFLMKNRELDIIYGAGDDALAFGYHLLDKSSRRMVLFVGGNGAKTGEKNDCVHRSDTAALNVSAGFLKRIGVRPGSKKVNLYALDPDPLKNLNYAKKMQEALEKDKILKSQASLVCLAYEPDYGGRFVTDSPYGYGSLHIFDIPTMNARLLIQAYPPYKYVSFDEKGLARNDFRVMIVGFGETGQVALVNLAANGQFEGSTFHADVFAPDCEDASGPFRQAHKEMFEQYDIRMHSADGRSVEAAAYLKQHGRDLQQIVVSTGDAVLNREILQTYDYLFVHEDYCPDMLILHRGQLSHWKGENEAMEVSNIYKEEILSNDSLDRTAKIINQTYSRNDKTPDENWAECPGFSRMSSRASADFMEAYLKMAGKTADDVKKGAWDPDPELLENMAKTEHLRWCAFQWANGYSVMPDEVWQARAEQYRKEKEASGQSRIRITKDDQHGLHGCLIPWDDLDELSRREAQVTGSDPDYKQRDRDNILAVSELVKALDQAGYKPK